ncbi:MAG: MATE family efflux transporter [Oscillospiraceae bacterium]|nr:MATE family efflux transporter [Oscillospiraceae bacterium]
MAEASLGKQKYDLKYMAKLSWPVFIEYGLSALVGLADTVMVSGTGSASVSAVGLVDSINMAFLMIYNAIATGTTVIVAQGTGAGDKKTVFKAVGQSLLFGVMIMLVVGGLVFGFRGAIFGFLYPEVEQEVRDIGLTYMGITVLSYPLMAVFSNLAGSMRGIGKTRSVMVASFAINAVNVGLNALFIYVFEMGATGAAIATVCGRFVGCVMLIWQAKKIWGKGVFAPKNMRLTKDIIKKIMTISIPSGLDTALFQAGKIIVSVFIGTMGTTLISANTIASSLFGMVCIPGNALAVTGVTMTGQAWGAGERRQARANLLKCCWISVGLLFILSIILWFPSPYIIALYQPEPEAAPEAVRLLRLLLIMIPVAWPTAFCSASGLRAADCVKFVTVVSIVSMWVFRVGFAWLLGMKLGWGPFGVFIAMGLDWVCRSAFYMPKIFFSKKLKTDVEVRIAEN